VTAGDDFTCALTAQGKAYCWGLNEGGQLGAGSVSETVRTPVPVAGEMTFADLSAGREHTCGITGDGRAYCWGRGGALGTGEETARVPTPVATAVRFAGISAGDQRTCAAAKEGAVYCWGRFSRPSADPGGRGGPAVAPIETSVRFRSVRAGLGHACGIATDSQAYCWGTNTFGELGVPPAAPSRWAPPQLVALGAAVTDLSVSSHGTCAVTAGGTAYCWGSNFFGQLGNGAWTERYAVNATPSRIVGDQRWRLVSTSGGFTCGLTVDGNAYCWGTNASSERLLGSTAAPDRCGTAPPRECSTRPARLAGNFRFQTLSTGGSHTCGITTDARLYCWGANDSGQLGNGTTTPSVEPAPVAVPASGSPP
jgi:alpha-tubulin suppressor-like RCC1 family protein